MKHYEKPYMSISTFDCDSILTESGTPMPEITNTNAAYNMNAATATAQKEYYTKTVKVQDALGFN